MVSLKFRCSVETRDFLDLEIIEDRIHVVITNKDEDGFDEYCGVILDKYTAVKLSKELRKQIALLD